MPPDISCIFCEIISKRAPADVIFEDERNTVFLPLEQELFGHALIIPKPHYETLLDIQPARRMSKADASVVAVSLLVAPTTTVTPLARL